MHKKRWLDPALWFLLLANGYLIYYCYKNPDEFNTVVWVFYFQSLLIGLFNFLNLLLIKNPAPGSLSINKMPVSKENMGCTAIFFLIHYGFFHLVYLIFLIAQFTKGADFKFVLIAVAIFLAESIIQFIRSQSRKTETPVNAGLQFITPYLRIVPMHLMILLPSFLGVKTSIIFLFLKTVADAGMYLLTRSKTTVPTSGAV
jgi:Family of unknown function (DUF6498)